MAIKLKKCVTEVIQESKDFCSLLSKNFEIIELKIKTNRTAAEEELLRRKEREVADAAQEISEKNKVQRRTEPRAIENFRAELANIMPQVLGVGQNDGLAGAY